MSANRSITTSGIWTDEPAAHIDELLQGMETRVVCSPRAHSEGVMLTVLAAHRAPGEEKGVMCALDKGQALQLASSLMDALEESEQLACAQVVARG